MCPGHARDGRSKPARESERGREGTKRSETQDALVQAAGDQEAWRRQNLGRLLNRAIHRFESRVLALLAQEGFADVRLAHVSLTRNLDLGGTRASEIASRATMTKQAMSELITQCEQNGIVRREPDPADARAKIVHFTDRGREFMYRFRIAVMEAQAEISRTIGQDEVELLLELLGRYVDAPD